MSTALAGHELVLGYARSMVVHGVSVGLEAGVDLAADIDAALAASNMG